MVGGGLVAGKAALRPAELEATRSEAEGRQ